MKKTNNTWMIILIIKSAMSVFRYFAKRKKTTKFSKLKELLVTLLLVKIFDNGFQHEAIS